MACSLFSAYWTPLTYAPVEFASEHFANERFVIRFGSESGSMMVTIRRLLYFGLANSAAIGSMYCVW
jgi:hypothetical protein